MTTLKLRIGCSSADCCSLLNARGSECSRAMLPPCRRGRPLREVGSRSAALLRGRRRARHAVVRRRPAENRGAENGSVACSPGMVMNGTVATSCGRTPSCSDSCVRTWRPPRVGLVRDELTALGAVLPVAVPRTRSNDPAASGHRLGGLGPTGRNDRLCLNAAGTTSRHWRWMLESRTNGGPT